MQQASRPPATNFLDGYPALDPITFQVIGSGLEFICREMGVTTIRSANSPIIVDVLDFSCAILDRDGQLAATANFDPSHLSAMAYAVEAAIMEIGYDDMGQGDVVVHNDPYLGGTHIPDFTVIKPIFEGEELIGFAANRAHHVDAGGKSAGGLAADAREIYAEGLRVPVVRWYRRGVENVDLFRTILLNIRVPDLQEADFRAQMASCVTAETRVLELCERYGSGTVLEAMAARQDYSEMLMRGVIERIPNGEYAHDDFIDDDGNDARAHRIAVRVAIDGSDVTVDFTGSSAQAAGPTNSVYGMTWASTFNALLQMSPPDMPFNSGCFRPVKLIAPRHTLVSPQPPAAVFAGTVETSLRTIDAIVGALIKAMPDDLVAATYGTAFCFGGGGFDPSRGSDYAFFFVYEGGWGGSSSRDGWTCVPNQTSNFKDTPVEIMEHLYPFRCDAVRLRRDSAGAGRFRGGVGSERSYTVLSGELTVGCYSDRFRTRPYGVFGGFPGQSNELLIHQSESGASGTFQEVFRTTSPSKFTDVRLSEGDRFVISTGGGGGYGDPLERDPAAVRTDVLEEVVSHDRASDTYGVVLTAAGDVDSSATETCREQLRQAWAKEPPFATVAGGVLTVDDAYLALTKDPLLVVPVATDRSTAIIERARARIDDGICVTSCPRRGDARLCPWHSAMALEFVSLETFTSWSKAHCPQLRALLPELRN